MAPMVGTTCHTSDRIGLLEASLDPIRPSLLWGSTIAIAPDEVKGASGTFYLTYDLTDMECLQKFATAGVGLRQCAGRDTGLPAEVPTLCRWEYYQSHTRFVTIVANARRDALYTFLLGSASRTGEWGESCGHVRDPVGQPSTSESCDVALEALCEIESRAAIEISQRGITAEVRTAIRLAEETFGSLDGISLGVAQDPEIPERRTIRMTLRVSGEPDAVFREERQFKKQLYKILDSTAREMLTLTYEWAS